MFSQTKRRPKGIRPIVANSLLSLARSLAVQKCLFTKTMRRNLFLWSSPKNRTKMRRRKKMYVTSPTPNGRFFLSALFLSFAPCSHFKSSYPRNKRAQRGRIDDSRKDIYVSAFVSRFLPSKENFRRRLNLPLTLLSQRILSRFQ